MRPHKKLEIWELIITFIAKIYELTKSFPPDEKYGIILQMKRSAVSIASNVAEGAARHGNREKIQFYYIARASLSELDAQLEISLKLGFISKKIYEQVCGDLDRISRMLQGLLNSRKHQQK